MKTKKKARSKLVRRITKGDTGIIYPELYVFKSEWVEAITARSSFMYTEAKVTTTLTVAVIFNIKVIIR